jgi:hypothetical protein
MKTIYQEVLTLIWSKCENKKSLISELKNIGLELKNTTNGREGVDFLIGENQLYLQSIDLDTSQWSIK